MNLVELGINFDLLAVCSRLFGCFSWCKNHCLSIVGYARGILSDMYPSVKVNINCCPNTMFRWRFLCHQKSMNSCE